MPHRPDDAEPIISPEQFHKMLFAALDDPVFARSLARRLLVPTFPIQGGACTVDPATILAGNFSCTGDSGFTGGKLGVGTASPGANLHVKGSSVDVLVGDTSSGLSAIRLLGSYTTDYAHLQAGVSASDTSAKLRISRINSSTSTLADFQVYSDQTSFSGNVGIATTSPLVKLDARGANAKATTASFENTFEVASNDSSNPLALRAGIKTDSTAGNRYGAIEVDDAGTKRNLALQPSGGNVGIGTTNPKRPLHVKGGDAIVEEGGGFGLLEPGRSDPTTVLYRPGQGGAAQPYEGEDITILRTYRNAYYQDQYPNKYTLLRIWSPEGDITNTSVEKEATLALVRGDEGTQEYLDLYNNGYDTTQGREKQYGIRIAKTGSGTSFRDFVFDQYNGTTDEKIPLMILKADTKVGIGTTTPQTLLDVAGQARVMPTAYADLPAAGGAIEGAIAAVTNANTNTWGANITGTGSNHVLAYCNGTYWTVIGK